MQKDPKRRAVGSVLEAADLVKARLDGRPPLLAEQDTELGNFPGLGFVAGRGARRSGHQGTAVEGGAFPGRGIGWRRRGPFPGRGHSPNLIVQPPIPGGLVQTISGALVAMPTRPLRGIRPVVKPEDTRLIGRPRAW